MVALLSAAWQTRVMTYGLRIEAFIVVAGSFFLDACGPSASGARPCEDGFIEHVVIENQQDIANLARINHVRRLEIVGSELETLEGLDCIEWVETLRIEDNARLTRLTGLEGLTEVRAEPCDEPWATVDCVWYPDAYDPQLPTPPGVGEMIITGNPRLESMGGLDALEVVHVALEIRDNASLVTLEGLESLAVVQLYLLEPIPAAPDGRGLQIERNPRLEGLDALVSYRGGTRLEVRDNAALVHLLPALEVEDEYIGRIGALVLDDLPALVGIEGLAGKPVDWLEIRRVPLIEELPQLFTAPEPSDGETDYRFMFRLVLESNPALRSIAGLPSVAGIQGSLIVRDNDALLDLTGLERLEWVDSFESTELAVSIEGNASLLSLDALDPAREGSFHGHFNGNTSAIRDNPELPTCLIEELLGEDASSWIVENNGEQPCS